LLIDFIVFGKVIWRNEFEKSDNQNTQTIDLGDIDSGVYFVELKTSDLKITQKNSEIRIKVFDSLTRDQY
jgi:hypothetical protein